MKRHRKRSHVFHALLLSVLLVVGLIGPAAADMHEAPEVEDDLVESDICVLHVDLDGDKLHKDRYQRPGLQYKKQVKTFRTEFTYDKEKWVPGVDQYKYKKQVRTREWNKGQDEILEYRYRVRTPLYGSKEVKDILGWDFGGGGETTVSGTTIPGHWFQKEGWNTIPDVVINAVWGPGGVPQSVLGTGSVNLNVYGGPNQLVQYDAHEVQTEEGYTDWSDWSDWSTDDPGAATDLMEVESRIAQEASAPGWGEWGEWTWYTPHQVTNWLDGARTHLFRHNVWWTVGQAQHLGDLSKQYRYVEYDSRVKPGTKQWVPYLQDLGPAATEPSTDPFWIGGTKYRYTNVQSHEVFTGWEWFKLGGKHVVSDWLRVGQKIDTGLGFSVWPGQQFDHGNATYRYRLQPSKVRLMIAWVVEDVAGEGTTPPPGDDWVKTGTWVVKHNPNKVKVTINGEVVEDAKFGESYTESFLLDHGDEYLVEVKRHGDEDWSVDQEGVADCDQPDSLITFTEWEDGEIDCDELTMTTTRTKTTTPFIWDAETRTWVEDEENVVEETETDTRPLTDDEIVEHCTEVEDEVIEEEPEVEPVIEEKIERVSVETEVLAETLPQTGASVVTLLVAGLLALFTGAGTLVTRRKR